MSWCINQWYWKRTKFPFSTYAFLIQYKRGWLQAYFFDIQLSVLKRSKLEKGRDYLRCSSASKMWRRSEKRAFTQNRGVKPGTLQLLVAVRGRRNHKNTTEVLRLNYFTKLPHICFRFNPNAVWNIRLKSLTFRCRPWETGELEKPEKIEQISDSSHTPLEINFSKPKRNHKDC